MSKVFLDKFDKEKVAAAGKKWETKNDNDDKDCIIDELHLLFRSSENREWERKNGKYN